MNDQLDKRQKNYILMRSIRDYGMGVLFMSIGFLIFFSKQLFNRVLLEDDPLMRYMVLVLFTLYGGFRIWRGYAKHYYNKDE